MDRILSRIERHVILVSYMTLILLVGVETIRRMVTREQAVWGPEVALYAFIWLSWFSMSSHLRNNTHLAFTEFRNSLPGVWRRALDAIDCVLWMVVGGIIIVTSYSVVMKNIEMGQTVFGTNIPLAAASAAVPVGWLFSMIRVTQRLFDVLLDRVPVPLSEMPSTLL